MGAPKNFFRLDHFDYLRLSRIRLYVDDMHARRAQPRYNQVAALDVRMRRIRAKGRAARIPAEMVQLIAELRQGHLAHTLAVGA